MIKGLGKKVGKKFPSQWAQSNNIKYLGVTLTMQVKNLYDKNFTSLKREIREDIRRWKDFPWS